MLGAGAGWIIGGVCFLLIDSWRSAPVLLIMSDAELVKHAAAVKREVIYRFPSQSDGEAK